MSAIQDQPGQGDMPTLPTPPPPPWFYGDQGDPWARDTGQGGWGGPGAPGGPGGWGGGGGWNAQPPRRPRRRRGVAITAAVAAVGLAAGAAGFHFARSVSSASPAAATAALSTSQIATKTDPGLVDVVSTLGDQNAEAAGTGQVITSSGEVLTNDHVITGATSIKATDVGNGRTYTATVVGYDQTDDVAVIQLEGATGLATVSFGNSSQVTSGSPVVALGNAGGKGGTPSVAAGSITALNQSITASDDSSGASEQLSGMLETNADIQPGDSGGPLVNGSGQVIGMDTAAYTGSGGSSNQSPYGQGPDGQSPWWQFPSGQSPSGGSGQSPSGGSGQSPSGQSPSSSGQSQTQGYAIPIDRALSIASEIEGGHASSTVHIGATGFLGVELSSESSSGFGGQGGFGSGGQGSSGVALQGVLAGSPAAEAGLSQGDVITSIAGRSVSSQSTIESVIQQYHPGDKVSVGWSDEFGQSHTATITLATGPAD